MNYEAIFRQRGAAYAHAMARWPDARREEFGVAVTNAQVAAGQVVLDVPAGGGYLQRYLPAGSVWQGHEPCASFFDDEAVNQPLLPLPWADSSADAALSIAGVHHLDDRGPLYRELRRVLRPGGRFVLADVHEEAAVGRFLDGFVGAHNSTGHRGNYLSAADVALLQDCGFHIRRSAREAFAWWFPDRQAMGEFCGLLFDMRDIAPAAVADGIEERLGVVTRDGLVGMCWELFVVVAERAQA